MKKILIIIAALFVFACTKKEEDPKPAQQSQEEVDQHEGMIKITTWSNRKGYYFRRKPYQKDWTETKVNTNTATFYEVYCDCITDYGMMATHMTSYVAKDSLSITVEYKGKKGFKRNLIGTTFAFITFDELK